MHLEIVYVPSSRHDEVGMSQRNPRRLLGDYLLGLLIVPPTKIPPRLTLGTGEENVQLFIGEHRQVSGRPLPRVISIEEQVEEIVRISVVSLPTGQAEIMLSHLRGSKMFLKRLDDKICANANIGEIAEYHAGHKNGIGEIRARSAHHKETRVP